MEKLAIFGGEPVRKKPFPPYHTFDDNEARAVQEVISGQVISDFIGACSDYFYGGTKVLELEKLWAQHAGTKYAIAMNSASSVIIAAMGAFGIGPGDEVIVTPYSHVISATAPLIYDAIPVFADSEPDTLCMSVESIRRCITPRTKAMIVVDVFGQSADMDGIMALAKEHDIKVLSDSAHITKAKYKGRLAGTHAHIGSYSLNAHKTIQCGEGGIAVTDDDDLAFRLQLLRNHAENCVEGYKVSDLTNLIGYNFRMTELEAAVAVEQVKKLHTLVDHRRMLCEYLSEKVNKIPGLTPPIVRPGAEHDYLLFPVLYDEAVIGVPREEFLRRLDAEGLRMVKVGVEHVPPISTFVRPIHLLPIFTKKTFRPKGYPWTDPQWTGQVEYGAGVCPVVEDFYSKSLFTINAIYPPLTTKDMDDIAQALLKVASAGK